MNDTFKPPATSVKGTSPTCCTTSAALNIPFNCQIRSVTNTSRPISLTHAGAFHAANNRQINSTVRIDMIHVPP